MAAREADGWREQQREGVCRVSRRDDDGAGDGGSEARRERRKPNKYGYKVT